MAGTVTTLERNSADGKLFKIVFDWTAHTDGTAEGDTTYQYYTGRVIGATTDPDTNAPDADYDIAILDGDGHDVCLGALSNRHTSNVEHVGEANLSCVIESPLTLSVSGAGSGNQGKVILWISRL